MMIQRSSGIALSLLLIGIQLVIGWIPSAVKRQRIIQSRTRSETINKNPWNSIGMSTMPTDDELLPADANAEAEQENDFAASFFNDMECDNDDDEGCEIDWDKMLGFSEEDEGDAVGEG